MYNNTPKNVLLDPMAVIQIFHPGQKGPEDILLRIWFSILYHKDRGSYMLHYHD